MFLSKRVSEAPSAIITQFAGTFTVWILAEHLGLSGILTKAEAHCAAKNIQPEVLLGARLYPDMLPFSKQILIILAGTSGFLDDMPVNQVRDFEKELYKYVDATNPAILRTVMEKKILDDALKGQLTTLIKEAKQQFVASREAVAK